MYLEYDPTAAAVDENPDAAASMSYVGSDHTFLNEEEKVFVYTKSAGFALDMGPRLREFYRQNQSEVVNNSSNKIVKTWVEWGPLLWPINFQVVMPERL